ncbi:hypothetical protein PGT21_005825 [Puccinia graminis f. sp. tritici]|uniref:Uncharacterized protein n=1 Tax=Puccinia graminis f. sp. tritici TaxID=56615 RepID=A0A5B0QVX2_PUCGR|nr:hypothetical protein PGT21_005825 [Puccinia graminis f. sp. tritici]
MARWRGRCRLWASVPWPPHAIDALETTLDQGSNEEFYGVPEVGETGQENGSVMRCTHHRKGEHTVGGIHHPPDGQPNRKTSGWRNVRAWGSYRSSNRTRRPYHVVGPSVPQQNLTVAQPFKRGLCSHLTGPVVYQNLLELGFEDSAVNLPEESSE